MKNTLRSAAIACLVWVGFTWSPRANAADLPMLDQVIDRHIQAIGGREALSKLGALALSGRCESSAPEESGPIEILVKTPKVVYDLNGGGLRMGFDGESVWREAAQEGLQQRKGRQFVELVAVFDPAWPLLWKEWYPQLAVQGVQKIGDREAYVLETQPGSPATQRMFIDRESGLLVRHEVVPQIAFTFGDYREVRGVRAAFSVQQTTAAGITYTYRFEKMSAAGSADDAHFQPR
jgi:hypothetical protein